jgi:hypothetical protein
MAADIRGEKPGRGEEVPARKNSPKVRVNETLSVRTADVLENGTFGKLELWISAVRGEKIQRGRLTCSEFCEEIAAAGCASATSYRLWGIE